jgi:hypothetical protein
MGDALLMFALAGWLAPFLIEFVCRGTRPISDAIARAAIGSISAYLVLIHMIAAVGWSSRATFVGAACCVGFVWIVLRIKTVLELLPDMAFPKHWIRFVAPAAFVGMAATAVLVQPHFSYTGFLIDSVQVTDVKNVEILTPYFSDEWASVAFVDQALTTRGLPVRHPFAEQSSYVSYMTAYFMGLTAFFSTFAFDPVYEFAYAPLLLGIALVYAAYNAARSLGASRVAAVVAALSIPFIANSANLAGIWYAIPAHAGLLLLVLTLSLHADSIRWRMMGYIVSVFLYPPIIVFVLPVAFSIESAARIFRIVGAAFASGLAAIIVAALSPTVSFIHSIKNAFGLVVRPLGLDFAGDIAIYPPHVVIPTVAVAGCVIAAPVLIAKHRAVGVAILVGIIGWITYSIISVTVVIDVQRVVFITAFLICIAAALGYDAVLAWIQKTISFNPTAIAWAMIVIVMSHVTPSYSAQQSWRKFVLPTPARGEGTFLIPSPPASQYLIQDDLDLLARFDVVASSSPRRFISSPWKGLALGAVTRHIPLHTKASIVGTMYLRYEQFIAADCEQLEEFRVKHAIDFAYVPKLATCPNAVAVATSTEGFVLYEMRSL